MSTLDEIDEEFIGRCYTKARRAPLVHGVVRSVSGGPSLRLPGGPYTVTQLAAIVISVGLLVLSRPFWGGHGLADLVVLLVVPSAAAISMRYLHVDGRNPAAAMASVLVMLASPRRGRIHGRPLRPVRPERDAPLITLTIPAADAAEPPMRPAPQPRAPRPEPRPVPPRGRPEVPVPMASGVQALLARRARTDLET